MKDAQIHAQVNANVKECNQEEGRLSGGSVPERQGRTGFHNKGRKGQDFQGSRVAKEQCRLEAVSKDVVQLYNVVEGRSISPFGSGYLGEKGR